MKLSEIKEILEKYNLQLTKSLGQNFLHDENQLHKIASAGNLVSSDKVLEIGPGLGPLTECLLESGAKVLSVELDKRFIPILEKRFENLEQFSLQQGDGLTLMKEHGDWRDWKLVANLPYSVASPILFEAALNSNCFKRIVVTLQWEVVNRIAAQSDTDDYGILSLIMQLRYNVLERFKIRSGCFFPAPDVDSGVIVLERRAEEILPLELHKTYVRLVRQGFSQRRKMMKKLLKMFWSEEALTEAFRQVGLSETIRAEKVTLKQFVLLTRLLSNLGN